MLIGGVHERSGIPLSDERNRIFTSDDWKPPCQSSFRINRKKQVGTPGCPGSRQDRSMPSRNLRRNQDLPQTSERRTCKTCMAEKTKRLGANREQMALRSRRGVNARIQVSLCDRSRPSGLDAPLLNHPLRPMSAASGPADPARMLSVPPPARPCQVVNPK